MDGTVARRLLAVDPGATRDELRRAFRQRSKSLHPDLGGDADGFVELCRAYDHLVASAPTARPTLRPMLRPTPRYAAAAAVTSSTWHVYDTPNELRPRRHRPCAEQRSFAEVLAAAM
jgi:hypothetical protein